MPPSYGDKLMCSFDYSSNTSATSACALRASTTRAMRSSDATSLVHTKATYTNISKTLILFPPSTADRVLSADLWMKLIYLPLLLLPGTTHLSHCQEIRGVRITHAIKKAETNSHLDKEALTITFGVKEYHQYLYDHHFK